MTPETYRAMAAELTKLAEQPNDQRPTFGQRAWHATKVMGAGLGGWGAGYLTGYLVGHGLNKAVNRFASPATAKALINPERMNAVSNVLANALGTTTALWKMQERQELQRGANRHDAAK